jgi:phage terminase large subunit GpA-like protein
MRCVSEAARRYQRVVVMMGSQMGKTASLLNEIGHKLDDDPAPILYVGPTKSNIDGVIEPQITHLLRSAPSLWAKTVKGRLAQKLVKRVAGVTLRLAWAGSPTEMASQPAHTVLVDELDRMTSIPGEGDPMTLAEARIATYPDGRLIVTSTPTEGSVSSGKHPTTGVEHWEVAQTDDVVSAIWRTWQEGTRHEWAVPCPECSDYFVPRFKLLTWPEGCTPQRALKEARLSCPNCGALIEDRHRSDMNARGQALAPGQWVEAGVVCGDPPEAETFSFWASGLMSPWVSWGQRAAAWLRATRSGDPDRIRSTINTAFGELYRIGADAPPWESVRALAGGYSTGEVPAGVRVITCGVDVQKLRLLYVVRGWGARSESWLLEHGEIHGETEREEVWDDLAGLLQRRFGSHAIRRMGVDSGYRPGDKWKRPTNMVYAFCRLHQAKAIATKGHESLSKPLAPSMIDVTLRGKTFKAGLQLWHLDSDYFKQWVHARLQWPADQPGAWHVPSDVSDDYCQQVTAEARVVKPSGKVSWVRLRKDNHYLDCEAINVAVAHSLGLHRYVAPAAAPPAEAAAAPVAAPVDEKPQRPTHDRWVGANRGWFKR